MFKFHYFKLTRVCKKTNLGAAASCCTSKMILMILKTPLIDQANVVQFARSIFRKRVNRDLVRFGTEFLVSGLGIEEYGLEDNIL